MTCLFRTLLYVLAVFGLGLFIMFIEPSGKAFVFFIVVALGLGGPVFVAKFGGGSSSNLAQGEDLPLRIEVTTGPASLPPIRDDSGYLDAARSAMYDIESLYFREDVKFLGEVKTLPPVAFERFVAVLFKHRGYTAELTRRSGDQGVDIFVSKDGKKGVVQCKRLKGNVGQPMVRDLYGAMMHHQADEAYLVCTGLFSEPAQEWAKDKPIILIDSRALMKWVRDFGKQTVAPNREIVLNPPQPVQGQNGDDHADNNLPD